jgi:hypothetical protein
MSLIQTCLVLEGNRIRTVLKRDVEVTNDKIQVFATQNENSLTFRYEIRDLYGHSMSIDEAHDLSLNDLIIALDTKKSGPFITVSESENYYDFVGGTFTFEYSLHVDKSQVENLRCALEQVRQMLIEDTKARQPKEKTKDDCYERFPVQISPDTIVVLHLFHQSNRNFFEDCWETDCAAKLREDLQTHTKAARQFIDQLEDHWTPLFMMTLRDEIDKELKDHDKKYGTSFAKKDVE